MSTKKIALVTGGSRGLGKNSALALAKNGHNVVITYNSKVAEANAVVAAIEQAGGSAMALQLDVSKTIGFDGFKDVLIDAIQQKWNATHINFLVNNAGIDSRGLFADFTEEAFDSLVNVHFKGVYFLTQKLLPMLANGGGIVNFSTGLARFVTPGFSAYAAMKAGIDQLTKYMAKELGSRGIRANTVAPGPIETDFTREAFEQHPQMKDMLIAQTSLGRMGQPDDIGGIVAFLCSDAAKWVTAQRIEASGGLFL